MEKIEIYSIGDISNVLKRTNFIKKSGHLQLMQLLPTKDGHLKLSKFGFKNNEYDLDLGGGFHKTRDLIKRLSLGADLYYEIENTQEMNEIKNSLLPGATVLSINDEGLAKIESKNYFILHNISSLSKEELKKIRNLLDTKVWITESEDNFNLTYDNPNDGLSNAGYLLNYTDIKKLQELNLDKLLSEECLSIYTQKGNALTKTTLDEALDVTRIYEKDDQVEVKDTSLPAYKISTFYEYNPLLETPSFGEVCELILVSNDANGTPIWRKMPKIIQNEHSAHYASRAFDKGIRTVVELPADSKKIIDELTKEGKLDGLKEFRVLEEFGKDFLVEVPSLDKDIRNNLQI